MVWRKENDDIEPITKNEFLFLFDLNSVGCRENKNGQTVISDDLSALAPQMFEILNLWEGFVEVVKFIDNNKVWLDALMGKDYLYRTNNCRYGE